MGDAPNPLPSAENDARREHAQQAAERLRREVSEHASGPDCEDPDCLLHSVTRPTDRTYSIDAVLDELGPEVRAEYDHLTAQRAHDTPGGSDA